MSPELFPDDAALREQPSVARIYDYVLGGGNNFAVDRAAAEKILAVFPGYREFALANRAFLLRAVRRLLDLGIRQFLDLGCGLPTVGSVHEIAHRTAPESRIVYVDRDPIAAAACSMLTLGDDRIGVVETDLREVDCVLKSPAVTELLDLDEPVGLLMVAVLHFLTDDAELTDTMNAYHERLAPGSWLVASHATGDSLGRTSTAAAEELFARFGVRVAARTQSEFASLVPPWQATSEGVVPTNTWRRDGQLDKLPTASLGYAVIAAHGGSGG
ncbi:SAM-dependent methyltransferase [Kutzneria viridogrisea]|uniref:S-adenosyl methyltransferase n=2 Tax=Kutzneria TaxID=43356 RepID=W5WBM5_9PSEU|nr:SAM-dependent methyltransferase [Kutzneria albida]AHH98140.1 hypothetical protein KALB_4778 [Kutzneria albida DSM 43870]MBA8924177.1 trans-aconitate methyltransferase [Kutzneria viridogrisea]